MNPLWSAHDVAAAIGTTPAKIRKLVTTAGLPCIDVPGVGVRFDPLDVAEWVGNRKNRPKEAPRDGDD